MDSEVIDSWCEKDTSDIGAAMGKACKPGDILLLEGDLGVGKTVFSKGVGRGLGIEETISSPTFTILQIYQGGRLPLYHFDAYRIADEEEMEEIGFEDYLFGQGVCLIEWASRIQDLLPDNCRRIRIEKEADRGFDYRKITISPGRGE